MKTMDYAIAVTGLNATDNPGPGLTVIRAIRMDPAFSGRIVGLAYDTLDPGIYASEFVDDVFLLPYPSQGIEALWERLLYIQERTGIRVVIPTLDAELPGFMALEERLKTIGVGTFLPTQAQYDLRAKDRLAEMGARAGIKVPATAVISDPASLYSIHDKVPFPFFVKGLYYGAELARSIDEAVVAFHKVVAKWGLPVIVQEFVHGEELDVVAVGDGEGGLVGAVPMKKTTITDKGKGWAGVAIKDAALLDVTRRFMAHSMWRGPCEVEVVKDPSGNYHLLEVNPRFPAWSFLSAGAGMNLPAAVVRLAHGETVAPMTHFVAGTMFIRVALDQIAQLSDFQQIASTGEMTSSGGEA
jgi:carbamoyl-phosphate synthase large subunit